VITTLLSNVVKCSSTLERRMWLPNANIAQYNLTSSVGGMGMCSVSLSMVSPSFIIEATIFLTHVGKGVNSLK
jgi:hypothetical protein